MPILSRLREHGPGRVLGAGAVAALTLAGAIVAYRGAAVFYWRAHAQDGAPSSLAGDPVIRLQRTEAYLARPDEMARQAPAIASAAKEVLTAAPLTALALRQLGATEIALGRDGRANLNLAERVSRRDAVGQLLLIDLVADRGNASEVLAHYDRAVAVTPATKKQLFPVLAAALDDAEIRNALGVYAGRAWFGDFLNTARSFGAKPEALFDLLAEVDGRVSSSAAQAIRRDILWEAIRNGSTDRVHGLIARMPGGTVDGGFGFAAAVAEQQDANPLAWVIHEDDEVSVSQVSGGLTIRIMPERSGLAAERVTLLGPGTYELSEAIAFDPIAPQAQLGWTLDCLQEGASRRLAVWKLPMAAGQARISLSIPADCPIQHWRISAVAGVSQLQAQAQISELKLSRK